MKPKEQIGSGLAWSGRLSAAHWIVVIMSLVLTLGAWQYSKRQIEARILLRYETERDRAISLISVRMEKYEEALWAGVSATYSHEREMSHEQWLKFASSLKIEERYPGINGIGVIHFLEREQRDEYLAVQKVERPAFRIHPEHEQPFLMPITHIAPVDTNSEAVGLDVAHETNRRSALLESRDTGRAQITGPIVLVQDAGHTPGFLFYAPFYRGGDPGTVAGRAERFLGAVYAPFVVRKLMRGLLSENQRKVSFTIRDAGAVIYDEHQSDNEYHDPDPIFSERVPLTLYGRNWMLDIRTNLSFRADNSYAQSWIILAGGLFIDGLLLALFALMSNANHRAVRYAENLNRDLTDKTESLEEKNKELEQIVYYASHDLKTPIRGIGALTEMVIEDLGDYFESSEAHPDVRENLGLVLDRVRRMDGLARAVLEYSQIGQDNHAFEALCLTDLLETIAKDFGLGPDQISLSADISKIEVDPLGFRRVLENLIGNAVKYHADSTALKLHVSVHAGTEYCRVSVTDNGPGIDESHHDRVFNMFQKVGAATTAESSGIGLTIVRKTVEMHGGTVSLQSQLGAGSTFVFDWPLVVNNVVGAAA